VARIGSVSLVPAFAPIQVRVVGPDSEEATSLELIRRPARRAATRQRREHLAHATRIVARVGGRVVGVAAYEREGTELRVLDLTLDPVPPLSGPDVMRQLLDALELAALAGGCRRIVLLPAAVVVASALERLGYRFVGEGCAGGWLEKTLPA
jgi:hypothetical protein